MANELKNSSVAQYFAKNLQQVGFSSPTKAVLTTLKEAVDNSLDACEEHGIAPVIEVEVKRLSIGAGKANDKIKVTVGDNALGIPDKIIAKVFGEYLASSKFGRGQCTRGQQGIGISAATTWAMMTNARGAEVITKSPKDKMARFYIIEVELNSNKGIVKESREVEWPNKDFNHGTIVSFIIDGKVQLNGDAGLISYITGTAMVNPHATINYKFMDEPRVEQLAVTKVIPKIPEATEPHPHTLKLGEFIENASYHPKLTVEKWLTTQMSRVSKEVIKEMIDAGLSKDVVFKEVKSLTTDEQKALYKHLSDVKLKAPPTTSVLTIGEEALEASIKRMGDLDYFSVVSRKACICDMRPVQVEVAISRVKGGDENSPIQLVRFANRVPLQFDKSGCVTTKAVMSVNWKSYGLNQAKGALPTGSYIIAVSVTSPFIKFKNASKETIDASDELYEEIRLALIKAGQKLATFIKKEQKNADLEKRKEHVAMYGGILINSLARMLKASDKDKKKAHDGLMSILGRETTALEGDLEAHTAKMEQTAAKKVESLSSKEDEADYRDAE